MFVDKDSIMVNGVSWGQYLLQAKYDYNKLWAGDTGRNLAGSLSGTLIGIFPKITLTFRKLTKAEMNIVAPVLDSATQQLSYYDPSTNTFETLPTYTGDWGYVNKRISQKNDSFEIAFISRERR